jgi:hypothetical protein
VTVLLKLLYAAAITALFVLFVAFGIRTFYAPPDEPQFPRVPQDFFRPVPPSVDGQPQPTPTLTPEQQRFEEEQRRYQDEYEVYIDELREYHSVVFAISALFGVMAVGAGAGLPERLDALRLGLVGGGLGTLIYGVIQAERDLDDLGAAVIFFIVAIGLVLVGVAGYRWLSAQDSS